MLYDSEYEEVESINSKENILVKKCCYLCVYCHWNFFDIDNNFLALYCKFNKKIKLISFPNKVCKHFILLNILK